MGTELPLPGSPFGSPTCSSQARLIPTCVSSGGSTAASPPAPRRSGQRPPSPAGTGSGSSAHSHIGHSQITRQHPQLSAPIARARARPVPRKPAVPGDSTLSTATRHGHGEKAVWGVMAELVAWVVKDMVSLRRHWNVPPCLAEPRVLAPEGAYHWQTEPSSDRMFKQEK